VLPALVAAAGPEVARRLARFAAMALEDDDLLTSYAADALSRVRLDAGGLDAVGVRALLPPLRRRVLAQFLEAAGVGVDHELIERCTAAVERGGAATLGKARCLKCAGGTVRIAGPPPEHANRPGGPALELALDAGGVADGPSGVTVSLTSEPALGELTLAVAPGPLPFALRHRLPGDRVGRRKLQDVLVDLRVPEEHRDRVPLVCDADGKIVWVVGLWPARRGLPAGGRALYLTAQVSAASRAREWLLRYRLARNFRSNHSRKGF
jgi:tRNA(Ile)-lysidine synthase